MEININMSPEVMNWFLANQATAKKYIDALGNAGDDPTLFIAGLCKSYEVAEFLLPGKGCRFLDRLREMAISESSTRILEIARCVVRGAGIPEESKPTTTLSESHPSGGSGCLTVIVAVLAFVATCVAAVV